MLGSRGAPIWLGGIVGLAAVAMGIVLAVEPAEQASLAARYTARAAFPIFLLAYSASSIVRLWPLDWTRNLLRQRRQWGLGFALAHTIHLIALGIAHWLVGEMPSAQTLLGGGLAYGMMYVMALTSNVASMRMLGVWWKRIHSFGIHWLWFIFTFSYLGRVLDPERWEQGIIQLLLCIAALALRLISWRKRAIFSQASQQV